MDKMDENDLPLLSNIESVRARHYLLQLMPDVPNQIIFGSVVIFFDVPSDCELKGEFCTDKCFCSSDNSTSERGKISFPITLECSSLTIKNVCELKPKSGQSIREYLSFDHIRSNAEDFAFWNENAKVPLSFTQDKWRVKISNSDEFCPHEFPKAISIDYSTWPEGDSIFWRNDDKGDVCFFTAGSSINNRSLIPSQDRPFAMATWQAWIMVSEEYYVAMTGDEEPVISKWTSKLNNSEASASNNCICFYYFTSMVLPMATIAIAVGKWRKDVILSKEETDAYNKNYSQDSFSNAGKSFCNHVIYPCHMKQNALEPLIPVALVTSDNHLSRDTQALKFVKYVLVSAYNFLGPHPFKRLEIVVLPRCFPHLGLASPNLLLLSKSVVMNDSSFHLRLAHEISHSWFGITIGPKNWEEEWLSEGVATYLEDSIFVLALEQRAFDEKRSDKDFPAAICFSDVIERYSDFFRLRGHLRYKMLLSERENSDDELQVLCPEGLSAPVGDGAVNNGLNADKSFLQVHYLKGYFLLHHLSNMVSRRKFDAFLGTVAIKCHGQLISSQEFLALFYGHFSELNSGDNPAIRIFNAWLKNSDINSEIVDTFSSLKDNKLIKNINEHYRYWIKYDDILKSCQTFPDLKIQMNQLVNEFEFEYSDQIILLFEHLLQVKRLKPQTLKAIKSFYSLKQKNPEIRHRWCELIIKFKFPDLEDVSDFLVDNQSMGVYLYGELMISGDKKHAKLAKDTFRFLKTELSTNSKEIISSMLFGE